MYPRADASWGKVATGAGSFREDPYAQAVDNSGKEEDGGRSTGAREAQEGTSRLIGPSSGEEEAPITGRT